MARAMFFQFSTSPDAEGDPGRGAVLQGWVPGSRFARPGKVEQRPETATAPLMMLQPGNSLQNIPSVSPAA